jgi:uncharacterized membrane protein YkgB
MAWLVGILTKLGLLKNDLDYHLIRASMVIIFLFFGYQKWFEYEAQVLIPYISNGPLIFWMYPVFGIRGASWFLGVSEWLFGALLFLGFWNRKLGILGALGSCVTFLMTVTIIPFMPDGWAASAGGFPAMTGNIPFLMKDVVLVAASVYLLKQDVVRVSLPATRTAHERGARAFDGVQVRGGSAFQSGLHRDRRVQHFGHRASGLRVVRCRLEGPLIRARHLGAHVQVHGGDGEPGIGLLERHRRRRPDALRRKASLSQLVGQGHREAAGMGSCDQLLGVGSIPLLEARREGILGI